MKTLVITGASALGKTYLANLLMANYPTQFDQAKLYTTRTPRGNEAPTDRIFVTPNEFEHMSLKGDFIVQGTYSGSKYGYTEDAIHPKNKHLLVNIWPALVPEFLKLNHVLLLALQTSPDHYTLLEERMKRRGDSPQTIAIRNKLIINDVALVAAYTKSINMKGSVIKIEDDSSVNNHVLPWIVTQLGL